MVKEQHKILIAGLPPGSSSADLTKLVKPIGNPLNISIAVNADGTDRGFAFVQFADATTQQASIKALDKTALAGRTLNVRAVEERKPEGDGGSKSQGRGATGNRGRPCYDFARGKCMKGASCRWAHVAPPAADGARSRRPEWQQKRSGEAIAVAAGGGDAASFLATIPEDYCRKFQLGKCHRGEACRWKHVIHKPSTAGGEGGGAGGDSTSPTKRAASAPAVALAGKRARGGDEGGSSGSGSGRIGVDSKESAPVSPAVQAERLAARLRQKEAEWRLANPDHPKGEAVPAAAKRRDALWMAFERQRAAAIGARED